MNLNQEYYVVLLLLAAVLLYFKISKFKSALRITAKHIPSSFLRVIFLKLGGVQIGKNVIIGSNNFFGDNVFIGDSVVIGSNNIISNSQIESNCVLNDNILMSNTLLKSSNHVHRGVKFYCEEGVVIGSYCNILQYCSFEGISRIEIGSCCEISSFCNFFTVSSIDRALTKTNRSNDEDKKLKSKSISVDSNVWFGPLVTVYPGVSIGSCSGILSNSAVNKNVSEGKLVGGVPATVKRDIKIVDNKVNLIANK